MSDLEYAQVYGNQGDGGGYVTLSRGTSFGAQSNYSTLHRPSQTDLNYRQAHRTV